MKNITNVLNSESNLAFKYAISVCILLLGASTVFASETALTKQVMETQSAAKNQSKQMQVEINHLLEFVAGTTCEYERNGTNHAGSEAAKHIAKKYDYYEDDIHTTEEFIELSASKSSMSGKSYKIHCPNEKVMKSQDWLLQELQEFRGAN